MGLFQCLALWPGFSRSGSTISGGVILGLSHRAAADFTFIMAIPIMMGASLLSLIKNWAYLSADLLPFFIAGFISAFIVALFVVRFFPPADQQDQAGSVCHLSNRFRAASVHFVSVRVKMRTDFRLEIGFVMGKKNDILLFPTVKPPANLLY